MRTRLRSHARHLVPLLAAGLLASSASCRKPEPPAIRRESVTIFDRTFTVFLPNAAAADLPVAAQTLRGIVTRNRELLNTADPESELSRLNRIAGERTFPVSKETYRILAIAKRLSERTRKAFDITVAPLSDLWGFDGGVVPTEPVNESLIRAAMQGVGSHLLSVRGQMVQYDSLQTQVDLGEIQTSYSLDLATIRLRERGVRNILIDAGNVARSQGQIGEGQHWERSLTDPFLPDQELGIYLIDQGFGVARVTRNDRFVEILGRHYNGFIDPRTGFPANGTAAVHVIAPSATDAQALAQALFVVGVEGAPALLAEFPRSHALLIPDQPTLEIWMTEGFEERCTLVEGAGAGLHRLPVGSDPQ